MPVAKKTVKQKTRTAKTPIRPAGRIGKPATKSVPRITYATLKLDAEDHRQYDRAVERFRKNLGTHYYNYINGQERTAKNEAAQVSPADTRQVVSYFPKGSREDTAEAVKCARQAQLEWGAMPYARRLKALRRAADLIIKRRYDISAAMAFEVGKNRAESLAEVNESAELIRYYCDQMEMNQGYVKPLESPGPGQYTESVLRPYGVWAVISPWNFPMALATGMTAGALVAGNAVVFKPASVSPIIGWHLYKAYADGGVPNGVINLMVGPGSQVGEELLHNPGVDAIIFTGSKEVGMHLYTNFVTKWPKPVITEMGGKNPAIVTAHADLDEAAEGVMRAAFGFDGQKCSACSRVYVEASVKNKFVDLLVDYTRARVKVGFPTQLDTFMGPVIDKGAVETYLGASEEARRDGRLLNGGTRVAEGDLEHGYYVSPAIVDGLPKSHRLFKEELFVPFLTLAEVNGIEEALREANDVEYGLCAGLYSEDPDEVKYFLNKIEAGVLYVNRRAGATTGAWPGVNSFGGWKGSGSSGKSGLGPYYVQQFLREQSRWIVK